jgi:hypothetical protein
MRARHARANAEVMAEGLVSTAEAAQSTAGVLGSLRLPPVGPGTGSPLDIQLFGDSETYRPLSVATFAKQSNLAARCFERQRAHVEPRARNTSRITADVHLQLQCPATVGLFYNAALCCIHTLPNIFIMRFLSLACADGLLYHNEFFIP